MKVGIKGPVLIKKGRDVHITPPICLLSARVKHLFLGFAFIDVLLSTLQFSLTVSRGA